MPPPPQRVRFDAIGDAWRLYQADMAQWIVAVVLVVVITIVPIFIVQMVITSIMMPGGGIFGTAGGKMGSPEALSGMRSANLVSTFVAIPLSVCTQLLTAGLQRRALLQARGHQTQITEIFRLDGMGLHVLAFAVLFVLIALPMQLYFASLNDPSNPFALFEPSRMFTLCGGGLVMIALQILLLFTPLIIVDQHLSVGQAIKKSFSTFGPQFFPLLGVLICTLLLAMCGGVLCGIGVLFTLPVAYTIYGVIYNDFFRPAPVGNVEQPSSWYPRQS